MPANEFHATENCVSYWKTYPRESSAKRIHAPDGPQDTSVRRAKRAYAGAAAVRCEDGAGARDRERTARRKLYP